MPETRPPGPPPGWFPDPAVPGQTRWWDGRGWTAHVVAPVQPDPYLPPPPVSPIQEIAPALRRDTIERKTPPSLMVKRIYWNNLLRFRFWIFSVGGGVLVGGLVGIILPPVGAVLAVVAPALLGMFWLRVQMACRHCGRLLGAAKVSGPILKCPSCHEPTDLALAQGAK
jgi:hypothetical protein